MPILQLKESSEKKAKAEQQFIEALQQAQFVDEEGYRQAKLTEGAAKQLKQEIDYYHNPLRHLLYK